MRRWAHDRTSDGPDHCGVHRRHHDHPEVVRYLCRVLPAAIFGMLIVYCLKSVTPFAGSHGIPEAIALLVTVALHKWKHETLLSVAGGTLCYVLLVQLVF